jgi:hypothetical protein
MERPAQSRRHAERGEETRRHDSDSHALGLGPVAQLDDALLVDREVVEQAAIVAIVVIGAVGMAGFGQTEPRRRMRHGHQTVGCRIRQWTEQHGVNERENTAYAPDTDRERHRGGD